MLCYLFDSLVNDGSSGMCIYLNSVTNHGTIVINKYMYMTIQQCYDNNGVYLRIPNVVDSV